MRAEAAAPVAWTRADAVLTRVTPRSVLVATLGSAEPIVLEGAAVAIWEELATPLDDDQLAARVAARFGTSPDALIDDVTATTHALMAAGAIVGSR
jgi:hypothetical protein